MSEYHVPVLLEETLTALITRTTPDALYVDGTLGGGGHAREVLARTDARLIGIDRDADALAESGMRLAAFGDRFRSIKGNHERMPALLASLGVEPGTVDGILLDLGVSSHQLDEAERGFSYHEDAPLDMRMDREQALAAQDIVNGYAEGEIARILRAYGEEKFSARIAKAIVAARPIASTTQLADIIRNAIPAAARRTGPHPARRSFMALRIAVNGELVGLRRALEEALPLLRPGGRLCVITFHSLEDRIVKQTFAEMIHPCICPPKVPVCVCGRTPVAKAAVRKSIAATEEQAQENPRARSARLRAVERLEQNNE